MSIVVSVRVGEGLVVATDSASTVGVEGPEGQQGVGKVFNHATKLIQLRNYPIAVANWGASKIGERIIASLVEEYANSRPPLATVQESEGELSVKEEAEGLRDFFRDFYEGVYPDWEQRDQVPGGVGVLVGGYSGDAFFPEEYLFNIPQGQFQRLRPPKEDGSQDYGANWYGATDAIVRLHFGRDEGVLEILQQLDVEPQKIAQTEQIVKCQLQYPVPFAGMPLQDAVDYAIYLVSVTIGRYRFVVGAEICGGPIDVATITRDRGFQWVKRKELAVRAGGLPSDEGV